MSIIFKMIVIDRDEFKRENILVAKEISKYNVDANVMLRSTLATKTVYFNNDKNTITLNIDILEQNWEGIVRKFH